MNDLYFYEKAIILKNSVIFFVQRAYNVRDKVGNINAGVCLPQGPLCSLTTQPPMKYLCFLKFPPKGDS